MGASAFENNKLCAMLASWCFELSQSTRDYICAGVPCTIIIIIIMHSTVGGR